MRNILVVSTLVLLTACGGGSVSGDVGKACMAADRKAANPRLCSCVQQVANQTLTRSEQSRAADFFEDPHTAQETRQSDNASDERFWRRYKRFASSAKRTCG